MRIVCRFVEAISILLLGVFCNGETVKDDVGIDDGQVQFVVEHSLDEGATFVPRGTLSIQSLKSGVATIQQEPLSEANKSELLSLCQDSGLYLLRVRQNDVLHRTVMDSCQLIEASLRDSLTIQLDWRNQVVGVSLSPRFKTDNQRRKETTKLFETLDDFNTVVNVMAMEPGPQPDTAAYIQKLEEEKMAKKRGDVPDNRSFFAKYWMYIIPFVLILAMNSGGDQASGGGGGGGR